MMCLELKLPVELLYSVSEFRKSRPAWICRPSRWVTAEGSEARAVKAPAWPMARPPCWKRPKLVAVADWAARSPASRHGTTKRRFRMIPPSKSCRSSFHRPDLRHDAAIGHGEDSERQREMEAPGATGAWVQEQALAPPLHLRPVRVAEYHQPQPGRPVPGHVLAPVDHPEGETVEVARQLLRKLGRDPAGVGVAAHRGHGCDPLELLQDLRLSDVAGVQNPVASREQLQHPRPQQIVSVRKHADPQSPPPPQPASAAHGTCTALQAAQDEAHEHAINTADPRVRRNRHLPDPGRSRAGPVRYRLPGCGQPERPAGPAQGHPSVAAGPVPGGDALERSSPGDAVAPPDLPPRDPAAL